MSPNLAMQGVGVGRLRRRGGGDDESTTARMRCSERAYRYVWGVDAAAGWIDWIVKADLEAHTTDTWLEDGCSPGEPVFVAEPDAQGVDEGALLSVVFDSRRETSFLLVLDARSLDELARAEAPHHIPYGFHAQFARA